MAFDGVNLYITQVDDSNVYKITPPLPTGPVVTISVPAGDSRVSLGGPLTWDGSALWTVDYSTTLTLYRVNAATGATLFSCSIPSANPGSPALPGLTLPDGLHWTGIAGSELVLSGEVAQEGRPTAVAFIKAADCTITSFFVFPSSPAECCSGVAFDGATLWHSTDGAATVFQTDLSGVSTGVSFPDPQVIGFEDLESDRITFAPKCALWGTTAGQPTVAAYQIPCAVLAGRMNGGGSVFTSAGVRVTHGFELHCKTTQDPNYFDVSWDGNTFHLTSLTSAYCFDDPALVPNPAAAGFDTYVGSGVGLCNGLPSSAKWTFTDAGEPGKNDTATIVITGGCSLSVSGNLQQGNQQAHAQ